MMDLRSLKPFFTVCVLIATVTSAGATTSTMCGAHEGNVTLSLREKSFMINFSVGEEEYTDTIIFGSEGSFTMDFFGEIEGSSGFYVDLCGVLFFARFSGILAFESFSFNFYGVHLNPHIFGISLINFGDSRYIDKFSGTES